MAARAWAVAALFLPVLLPVAIVYARRAGREADCAGEYPWPKRLIDRPVVFDVVVWLVFFACLFVLAAALSAFLHVPPV